MTIFTLIAAMDRNQGIGIENRLPWQIPEDLQHFKRTTTGKPIVMGRKTFDSIGRALPNRHNVVVTRNPAWFDRGVSSVPSVDVAINFLRHSAEVCIIGGAEIYKAFLPHAQRLILTEIDHEFKCDAFFPEFDRNMWVEASRETHTLPQYPFAFSFVEYRRS
jgi:dihydrofolate reductase